MKQALLTLVCSPGLEQSINDWLLAQEGMPGFTSFQVYGHGSDPQKLSLVEQVEGRKEQVMFQLHLSFEYAERIIKEVGESFKGARIYYWLVPVMEAGNIGG